MVPASEAEQHYRNTYPRLLAHWDAHREQDREAFHKGLPEFRAAIESWRQANRSRLLQLLSDVGPFQLLASACITYLYLPDPNDTSTTRLLAHPEYLAIQALTLIDDCPPPAIGGINAQKATNTTCEALQLVRRIFEDTSIILTLDSIMKTGPGVPTPNSKQQFQTRLSTLLGRTTAKYNHIVKVLHGCFDSIDDHCRRVLGYTSSDALSIVQAVIPIVWSRAASAFARAMTLKSKLEAEFTQSATPSHDGNLPAWLFDVPARRVAEAIECLAVTRATDDALSTMTVSAAELASKSGINESAVQSFLDDFSISRSEQNICEYEYPYGINPLRFTPIIRLSGEYLFPTPQRAIESIHPRLEQLIKLKGGLTKPPLWEFYQQNRSRYLETESANLLTQSLSHAAGWTQIPWHSSGSPDEIDGELDGLVATDDICLRIECKGSSISPNARRGQQQEMNRAWDKIIDRSITQHERLDSALAVADPRHLGFTQQQSNALASPFSIRMIVTLEDVTVWAPRVRELQDEGALTTSTSPFWVVSVIDLMVITDLLRDVDLLVYLINRQRFIASRRFEDHEELRWLNTYLHHGHFTENREELQEILLLDSHDLISRYYSDNAHKATTAPIHATVPRPPTLGSMIYRLEEQQPPNWTLAVITLVYCYAAAQTTGRESSGAHFLECLGRVLEDVEGEDASFHCLLENVSKLMLVVYPQHRHTPASARLLAAQQLQQMRADHDVDNWILIGEGSDRRLFVHLRAPNGIENLVNVLVG